MTHVGPKVPDAARILEALGRLEGPDPTPEEQRSARCCGAPEGCVLCEVDGMPLTPEQIAVIRQRELDARAGLQAFAGLMARPSVAVGMQIAGRLTARERGKLRRLALDEADRAILAPVGHPGSGTRDRRSTHGGTRKGGR